MLIFHRIRKANFTKAMYVVHWSGTARRSHCCQFHGATANNFGIFDINIIYLPILEQYPKFACLYLPLVETSHSFFTSTLPIG